MVNFVPLRTIQELRPRNPKMESQAGVSDRTQVKDQVLGKDHWKRGQSATNWSFSGSKRACIRQLFLKQPLKMRLERQRLADRLELPTVSYVWSSNTCQASRRCSRSQSSPSVVSAQIEQTQRNEGLRFDTHRQLILSFLKGKEHVR